MNRAGRPFHFSPWPICLMLAAVGLAVGVFVVTQGVQARETKVAALNRELLNEQQTLRVLDAEWAYLTRPQRLEELMAVRTDANVMPPVPAPVANVAPAPQTVEPAAEPVEKTAAVATPEEDKPVAKADEKKPEQPKKIAKKEEPKKVAAKKAEPKKTASKPAKPVKLAAAKAPVAKKAASGNDVWRITPKRPQPTYAARPVSVSRSAQIPNYGRGGIARPIVE